ncbi:MAG: A24 family peptidase [Anaerolineales bacterium]
MCYDLIMDIFLLIIPIALGWLAGALVNYLGDVLPVTRRFSQPACPQCGGQLPWKEYLLLRGCPACGRGRSKRTYITQAVLLVATIYLWLAPPARLNFTLALLLLIWLGVVFVIDMEHRLILHPVSIVGAVLGFGVGLYAHGLTPTLLGGAFGFGVMLLFYFMGEGFARWMSKRRGEEIEEVALGFGDVNLCGITGLLLGWPVILAGLLFTIFAGGIASLLVIVVLTVRKRYQAFTPIPYAPFLILSILFYLFR